MVCYCDDCQAFAKYLGHEIDILDQHGGTDIFQLTPSQLIITNGVEHLRCMRLSSNGLIRWYADCCKTPIGNTVSADIPFVGLIHTFIDDDQLDQKLGPVRFYIQSKFATDLDVPQQSHKGVPLMMLMRTIPKLLIAKLCGQGQPTPFFDGMGVPVSKPLLLTGITA